MSGIYRYCLHPRVEAAEAMGWVNLGRLPGNHGVYSCLLFWPDAERSPVWFSETAA
jgi:hypothetical protein